jgi:hypothetical protein
VRVIGWSPVAALSSLFRSRRRPALISMRLLCLGAWVWRLLSVGLCGGDCDICRTALGRLRASRLGQGFQPGSGPPATEVL